MKRRQHENPIIGLSLAVGGILGQRQAIQSEWPLHCYAPVGLSSDIPWTMNTAATAGLILILKDGKPRQEVDLVTDQCLSMGK